MLGLRIELGANQNDDPSGGAPAQTPPNADPTKLLLGEYRRAAVRAYQARPAVTEVDGSSAAAGMVGQTAARNIAAAVALIIPATTKSSR
jgi:hypothetical protein